MTDHPEERGGVGEQFLKLKKVFKKKKKSCIFPPNKVTSEIKSYLKKVLSKKIIFYISSICL